MEFVAVERKMDGQAGSAASCGSASSLSKQQQQQPENGSGFGMVAKDARLASSSTLGRRTNPLLMLDGGSAVRAAARSAACSASARRAARGVRLGRALISMAGLPAAPLRRPR